MTATSDDDWPLLPTFEAGDYAAAERALHDLRAALDTIRWPDPRSEGQVPIGRRHQAALAAIEHDIAAHRHRYIVSAQSRPVWLVGDPDDPAVQSTARTLAEANPGVSGVVILPPVPFGVELPLVDLAAGWEGVRDEVVVFTETSADGPEGAA